MFNLVRLTGGAGNGSRTAEQTPGAGGLAAKKTMSWKKQSQLTRKRV